MLTEVVLPILAALAIFSETPKPVVKPPVAMDCEYTPVTLIAINCKPAETQPAQPESGK